MIYKTQRVLVAILETNFWILVASMIILVALATVLGAISCPDKHGSFVLCKFTFCIFVSLKKILGEIEAPHILVMPEMIWPKSQIGMIESL